MFWLCNQAENVIRRCWDLWGKMCRLLVHPNYRKEVLSGTRVLDYIPKAAAAGGPGSFPKTLMKNTASSSIYENTAAL